MLKKYILWIQYDAKNEMKYKGVFGNSLTSPFFIKYSNREGERPWKKLRHPSCNGLSCNPENEVVAKFDILLIVVCIR